MYRDEPGIENLRAIILFVLRMNNYWYGIQTGGIRLDKNNKYKTLCRVKTCYISVMI